MLKKILFILLFALVPFSAIAQQQGLYILGFDGGVNSAVQAPPGVYLSEEVLLYNANGIKDQNSNTLLPGTELDLNFWGNVIGWVSPFEVLGAHYAANLLIPVANPIADFGSVIGRRDSAYGLSDIYFEPLNFGWNHKRISITASYGFYAPTGRYSPGATNNVGRGTWTHQLNLGNTYYFDRKHSWSWTNWLRGEIHQKTRDTDLTIGDNIIWEWALAKTFFEVLDIGLVGYGQWQVTNATGSAAILPSDHNKIWGLGGELGLYIPKIRSRLDVRGYGQFGAELRTQGTAVFVTFSTALWNNKAPAAKPAASE
jgi:hypothetical protein